MDEARSEGRIPHGARPAAKHLALLLPVLLAVGLRLQGLSLPGLSYDELQSTTHAALPFPVLFESVKQFDPHSPLYYTILHFWMKIGSSESAVRSFSVICSLATLVIVYLASLRLYGFRVALAAAFLFACAPLSVLYAQQARMYACMMLLATGAWAALHLHLTSPHFSSRAICGVVAALCALLLTYMHGFGLLIYFSTTAYALVLLGYTRDYLRTAGWGALQALSILGALPWLLRAKDVQIGHPLVPGMQDVADTASHLFFGDRHIVPEPLRWLSFALYVLLILALLATRDRRNVAIAIAFLLVPLMVSFFVSHEFRAVWRTRTVSWVAPFVCVGIASLIMRGSARAQGVPQPRGVLSRWRSRILLPGQILAVTAACIAMLVGLHAQRRHLPDHGYRETALFLKEHASQDEVIFCPGRGFWGLAWYYAVPGSIIPGEDYGVLQPGHAALLERLTPEFARPGTTVWLVSLIYEQSKWGALHLALQRKEIIPISRHEFGHQLLLEVRLAGAP